MQSGTIRKNKLTEVFSEKFSFHLFHFLEDESIFRLAKTSRKWRQVRQEADKNKAFRNDRNKNILYSLTQDHDRTLGNLRYLADPTNYQEAGLDLSVLDPLRQAVSKPKGTPTEWMVAVPPESKSNESEAAPESEEKTIDVAAMQHTIKELNSSKCCHGTIVFLGLCAEAGVSALASKMPDMRVAAICIALLLLFCIAPAAKTLRNEIKLSRSLNALLEMREKRDLQERLIPVNKQDDDDEDTDLEASGDKATTENRY